MNEEDTFLRLRRIPLPEMLNRFRASGNIDTILPGTGWTWREFDIELDKYLIKEYPLKFQEK